MIPWTTWEELLLGGAILRHGIGDWIIVASELKTRTVPPCKFTPEVCKAKYEELQQQYSGYTVRAWFEELRKKRIVELKKDLEQSDKVIGSLELKLESLKVETDDKVDDFGVNKQELQVPSQRYERVETSKKKISTGSFMRETMPEHSGCIEQQKVLDVDSAPPICEEPPVDKKKTKRVRKRKSLSEIIETDEMKDLKEIVNLVLDFEGASAFCRKDDSQMRARYRETVRFHMDFDIIMSRIYNQIITTRLELFRDLLLLATNAVTFYSTISRKHKIALRFREFVIQTMKEKLKSSSSGVSPSNTDSTSPAALEPLAKVSSMHSGGNVADTSNMSPVHDPSVKIRSMRSGNYMVDVKVAVDGTYAESAGQEYATPRTMKEKKRGRKKFY